MMIVNCKHFIKDIIQLFPINHSVLEFKQLFLPVKM